jgi:hypothetical protein
MELNNMQSWIVLKKDPLGIVQGHLNSLHSVKIVGW